MDLQFMAEQKAWEEAGGTPDWGFIDAEKQTQLTRNVTPSAPVMVLFHTRSCDIQGCNCVCCAVAANNRVSILPKRDRI